MKRLGDALSQRLRHDPDPSETGNTLIRNPKRRPKPKEAKERRMSNFIDFLNAFILELNALSEDGWAVLVEGKRDVAAMESLGYDGLILSASSLARNGAGLLKSSGGVIVMTDMDREGRRLAARYSKMLSHEGFRPSLSERRRLLAASRGVFRHIENLSRFAELLGD